MKTTTHPRVITRFAPSPTGYLHVGGARTALFNFLFARHHGGLFRLRIEDTDKKRSTPQAIDAILTGMDWLGLTYDAEPVYQSKQVARHSDVAHLLLEKGWAYRCYMTEQELADLREEARSHKGSFRISSPWRDREEHNPDRPFVIRFKAPQEGEIWIEDKVQGPVTVKNTELDDMVLLRSDGTPTYMLAVVVDDHDMGVTHIIRGDDHLNNAFRQLALIRALEWSEPVYAHIPLIHGEDGAKLSKRHGALGVEAYRDEMGVLAQTMRNYLLRLGWGHGNEEIISDEQAIALFSLEGVGKSPSCLDSKKLFSLNGHYLRAMEDGHLVALLLPELENILGRDMTPENQDVLTKSMPELKQRAKSLKELAKASLYLFHTRPILIEERMTDVILKGKDMLLKAHQRLVALPQWRKELIEQEIRLLAEEEKTGLGKVAQPLRAALTGMAASPGVFHVLEALGKVESLGRIEDHLNQIQD